MLPIAMFMARAVRSPEAGDAYVRQDRPPSLGLRMPRPRARARGPRATAAAHCSPSRL